MILYVFTLVLIQHLWFLSLHSNFGTDVFTDFFVEILNYSTFVVQVCQQFAHQRSSSDSVPIDVRKDACIRHCMYRLGIPFYYLLLFFTVTVVICVCSTCLLKMIFLVCLHSAVERRSGVTGALTWPWCCLISHTVKTWILAPSPPWATRLVWLHQTNSLQMHQLSKSFYSLPQHSHLQFYLSALILFCGSFQGAD